MERHLKVATYNIHKGMTTFNRRHMLHDLKTALDSLRADLVFLQEVQGEHRGRAARHGDWPDQPQHSFLAGDHDHVYGRNAVYHGGHHGNAVLSRYPITAWHNLDISVNRLEKRGLLHASIQPPNWSLPLHALCIHLNLRAGDRRVQLASLIEYVRDQIPDDAPLVMAGDFNDWRHEATRTLHDALGLQEAFQQVHGRVAASFPAHMPVLMLDRIYLRGFNVQSAEAYRGLPWSRLSDHAPLTAIVRPSDPAVLAT